MNNSRSQHARPGLRLEYADRLAGYRFATKVRGSGGSPEVHVYHTHETVIVELVGGRPSDASRVLFAAASGAIG